MAFLCVGCPVLDIQITADDELMRKYDLCPNTATQAEERHMAIFTDALTLDPRLVASGAALNTARVCQWMIGIPGATTFLGAVGKDQFAELLLSATSSDGVFFSMYDHPKHATGTTVSLTTTAGERCLVANLGASNLFHPEHLKVKKARDFLAAAKFIYISGFFLPDNMASIQLLADICLEEDKIFMFNLAGTFLCNFFQEGVLRVIAYCDFLFANDAEARAFAKMKGWTEIGDMAVLALRIAALPKASGTRPRVVVITQGSGPTVVASLGKATLYSVESLANELIVDINGAGDSFVGGFASKLVQGDSLANCVRAGHWVARTVIQFPGCTYPRVCDFV